MHQNKSSLPQMQGISQLLLQLLGRVHDMLWTSTALLDPAELTGLSNKLTRHQGRLEAANSCDYAAPNW